MAMEGCRGETRALSEALSGLLTLPAAKRRRLSVKSSVEDGSAPLLRPAAAEPQRRDGASGSGSLDKQLQQQQQKRIAGAATPCRRAAGATPQKTAKVARRGEVQWRSESSTLVALAGALGGPYSTIASYLDDRDLCRVDTSCRPLREVNGSSGGPWRCHGERAFLGMELDAGSGFLPASGEASGPSSLSLPGGVCWKRRCELFRQEAPTFSQPFNRAEIANVENPDEVAYCRCRIRTDHLLHTPGAGVYVEVEVNRNADNLSLAVVDFEGGGRSSVTFSPETGAVLRERKVREAPRAIEGTYMHLLPPAPSGRRFEGTMGLYLQDGHLAFYRRWSKAAWATAEADVDSEQGTGGSPMLPESSEEEPAEWETTGFCTDLLWAQGPRLSVCLAFRDEGPYRVRMSGVGNTPPLQAKKSTVAYQEERWSLLYGDDDHPLAI